MSDSSSPIRLLIIPGSSRTGSLNVRLARAAQALADKQGGITTSWLDLRELGLPVYDGDLEAAQGVPEGAHRMLDAITANDALLIVTPEYNGFPTPLVINAFDWLSRIPEAAPRPAGLATTANKPVGLLSASQGPLGGLRSMNFLRQYFQMNLGALVVPQQFALGRAGDAYGADGGFADERSTKGVLNVLGAVARVAGRLRG